MRPDALVLISGPPGSGKTTCLREALALLAARGHSVRACLSEATARTSRAGGPLALGFDLLMLETQAGGLAESGRFPLARRDPPVPGPEPLRKRMQAFTFDFSAFPQALSFLRNSGEVLSGSAGTPVPEIMALDEIGPLELHENGGFMPFLLEMAACRTDHRKGHEKQEPSCTRFLLLTVRPSLIDELAGLLSGLFGTARVERAVLGENDDGCIMAEAKRIADYVSETEDGYHG